MKKFISIALAAVLALSLVACGNSDSLSGKVATDGSTSMEKVIGALKETFEGEHTGVEVTYNPTGSSAGITAVAEGRCDIGLSSRNLKDSEKEQGLVGTVLAYDGIAVIINPENTVEDLTVEQIAAIYTGEITNWSEVGGVAPSDETVKNETYAIQRPFVLVTKEGVELNETAKAFFDFITSSDANEVITAAGVVPAN